MPRRRQSYTPEAKRRRAKARKRWLKKESKRKEERRKRLKKGLLLKASIGSRLDMACNQDFQYWIHGQHTNGHGTFITVDITVTGDSRKRVLMSGDRILKALPFRVDNESR